MPVTKVQRQKTTGNRAAIYARVSDKSQDAEDKTSITDWTRFLLPERPERASFPSLLSTRYDLPDSVRQIEAVPSTLED